MTTTSHGNVSIKRNPLISKLRNEKFRRAYFEKTLKAYLANQIRAIRGEQSQTEFGKRIDATQSVVSRLEDEGYGKLNTQTLIDVANKVDKYLIIKFVDLPTFLYETNDLSEAALVPRSYDESQLDEIERASSESVVIYGAKNGSQTITLVQQEPYLSAPIPSDSRGAAIEPRIL